MQTQESHTNNGIRPKKPQAQIGAPTEKQKRYNGHLVRKLLIADAMQRRGYAKQAQALRECSVTEHLTACQHCGEAWWVTTKCRQRICPICAWKTANLRAEIIEAFIKDLKHPKFVTLTMPRWSGDPREGIKHLRDAFLRLRRSGDIPELIGGCYTIEVVPKNDGWHIHMHLIIEAAYVPQQRLIAAWGIALGVHAPSVDVRDAAQGSAAKYVAKYVTKSLGKDATPDQYVDLWEAIHGSRLFALFGSWYKDKAKLAALAGKAEEGKAKCPMCGERGCMFDVRSGAFLFGKDWQNIRHLYEPRDGRLSRAKEDIFRLTHYDDVQETSLDEEDEDLIPYNK